MNNVVFQTKGDWDSTFLENNGQEVLAQELLVDLHSGRDEMGNPSRGGVGTGGEMVAYIRTQSDPNTQMSIFPGHISITFPGHVVIVENTHPSFAFEMTRVLYNGQDVTRNIVELHVQVNADENIVSAYITLYKAHWISADEVATITIFG
jgi:hypothetical protein